MKVTLTKRNIAIVLIVILLFAMMPAHFYSGYTVVERMDFDDEAGSAVLFSIYFLLLIAIVATALIERYDIAKFASIISIVVIFITILEVSNAFNDPERLTDNIGTCYIYLILTIALLVITLIKQKKKQ